MNYAVVELCELAGVPAVGRAYEVARDALYGLELSSAFGAFRHLHIGVLIAALRAVVAVVVDRSITHVVLIHHVYDLHDALLVVGGVAVDLHIEDMAAARQFMIRSLHLGLVAWRAVIVDGYMVGVRIVVLIGDSRYLAEFSAVALGEASAEAFGRSGDHGIVVSVAL